MSEKNKFVLWLIILTVTVLLLRGSPQESKTYIILENSQNYAVTSDSETEEIMINGKKYIAVKEEANEEQIEDTVVVIIIIVMLLFIFGSSDIAQTGG